MRQLQLTEHVAVAYMPIGELAADEFEQQELASIGNAVAKRRQEFIAGRQLARQLLSQYGYKRAALEVLQNRLPNWPPGVVASISHTDSMVAVALAHSSKIVSLGLDIELADAATPDLLDHVLREDELQIHNASSQSLTDVFSAKEALFKGCYSVHEEYFEFTDVAVAFQKSHFSATAKSRLRSSQAINSGRGHRGSFDEHVASLFIIEQAQRA